jgi:hypothetical protein
VPDRVVDEVPDHALDELLITGRLGRPEVRRHAQPQPGDAPAPVRVSATAEVRVLLVTP